MDSTGNVGTLALYEIAMSYIANKEYENATLYIDKYIARNSSLRGYMLKASILDYTNRTKESIELYKDILGKATDENDFNLIGSIHYNLGICYFKSSEYEEAKNCFFNSVKYRPIHNQSNLLLAMSYQQNNQHSTAAAIYFYYMCMNPDYNDINKIFHTLLNNIMQGYEIKDGKRTLLVNHEVDIKELSRILFIANESEENNPDLSSKETMQNYIIGALDIILPFYNDSVYNDPIANYYLKRFISLKETENIEAMYNYATQNIFPESSQWLSNNPDKKQKLDEWFKNDYKKLLE